ncbi:MULTISPECIES: OmpH family outer membrane protein [unclassified Neisseria]|uniref:OmpH family outer membrane protein n=1 Tax=unclassified Neisseria TaxID=2623750 RepID=UPI001072BB37|nr:MULTISPECIES: OmpH family outer membrane protein [unclassified Neisseria]MBF0803225.1 OmpH family outer membrane protein [Neisseria sp. 19428wB4_WF04]TFU44065.1 OmpH family outer membrane protein [Neisseria sp. WF04]
MNRNPHWAYWCAAAVLGFGLMGSAAAEGVQKLGFINAERLYQESKQAQGIQKTLEKEFSGKHKTLQKIQQEGAALEKKLASDRLTEAEREKTARQLGELVQKFRLQQEKLAEEYNLRRNEEFAALQQNANRVIIDLAKKEGYDLILKDVIYVNSKYDITDRVIKAMNAR